MINIFARDRALSRQRSLSSVSLGLHMRAYHLVNEQFGMDDLVKKRLKIATLKDLNDPFELFAVSLTDSAVRRAFRKMKDELSRTPRFAVFQPRLAQPCPMESLRRSASGAVPRI